MRLTAKQTALLHVARRELAMEEDDYRAVLREWTPSGSSRDLAREDFSDVLDRFVGLGFEPKPRARALDYGDRRGPVMASPEQLEFLWDLWRDYTGGRGTERSLSRWLERTFGVSHARFLTARNGRKAIGALRKMAARNGGKTG